MDRYFDLQASIVISNIAELSPFLRRQEKAMAWALAAYDVEGTRASGFAYAALVDPGTQPHLDKAEETSGDPGVLNFDGPSATIRFRARRVRGSLGSATACRLYAIAW